MRTFCARVWDTRRWEPSTLARNRALRQVSLHHAPLMPRAFVEIPRKLNCTDRIFHWVTTTLNSELWYRSKARGMRSHVQREHNMATCKAREAKAVPSEKQSHGSCCEHSENKTNYPGWLREGKQNAATISKHVSAGWLSDHRGEPPPTPRLDKSQNTTRICTQLV